MLILGIISSIGLIIFAAWLLAAVKKDEDRKTPLTGAVICLILTLIGLFSGAAHNSESGMASNYSPQYETVVGSLRVSYQITETRNTDNKTQVIVSTKNIGSSTYSGTIDIKSNNQNAIYLDMDVIHFFNLEPDESRMSVCWLRLDEPPHIVLSSEDE